ncbi:MAG: dihydroorotase [Candidatus Krumholzibacteria bacterium]|nr:dihydroorotase [Candidatus Krumholzibacteria bacterium]
MIDWKDKREFWIAGARIADPEAERIRVGSVCVQKGRIAEIVWQKSVETDLPVLDAERFVLAPGFVDLHAHLREPGYEEKETIETGSAAAAAGGYTSVVCMANTNPAIDDPSVVEYISCRAQQVGRCRVYVAGALTKGRLGEIINEYYHLKRAGVVALSDDGAYVTNSQVMRSALEYANLHALPVISHCEDAFLASSSQMNEGYTSTRLGLKGSPAAAEEIAVSRDCMLAQLTGARLHVAHVSTAGAVELVRRAKKKGTRITAEATPHHLTLDDRLLDGYDANLKVNPPLRGVKDVEALRAGLLDGTIDCVATDHAPHSEIDKDVEFDEAPAGMIGLETAFAQLHTELVAKGVIDLLDLVKLMTIKPAATLGLPGGRIAREAPADLVLIDPAEEWTFEKRLIRSRSKNTPLVGARFTGRVQGVFLEGKWQSAV